MVFYLIGVVAVFLICFAAYRAKPVKYADLMGVSVLLSVVFVVGNLLVALYRFPDALLAFPILDLALAGMIYRAWTLNREPWKVVMVATLVGQLLFHMVTIALWKTGDLTQSGLYWYVTGINGLFAAQLLTLGSVGAGHGLDIVRRWLSDRRRADFVSDGSR